MTIDEAMKELNTLHECLKANTDQRFLSAVRLGIEALKWIAVWRETPSKLPPELLPGETED